MATDGMLDKYQEIFKKKIRNALEIEQFHQSLGGSTLFEYLGCDASDRDFIFSVVTREDIFNDYFAELDYSLVGQAGQFVKRIDDIDNYNEFLKYKTAKEALSSSARVGDTDNLINDIVRKTKLPRDQVVLFVTDTLSADGIMEKEKSPSASIGVAKQHRFRSACEKFKQHISQQSVAFNPQEIVETDDEVYNLETLDRDIAKYTDAIQAEARTVISRMNICMGDFSALCQEAASVLKDSEMTLNEVAARKSKNFKPSDEFADLQKALLAAQNELSDYAEREQIEQKSAQAKDFVNNTAMSLDAVAESLESVSRLRAENPLQYEAISASLESGKKTLALCEEKLFPTIHTINAQLSQIVKSMYALVMAFDQKLVDYESRIFATNKKREYTEITNGFVVPGKTLSIVSIILSMVMLIPSIFLAVSSESVGYIGLAITAVVVFILAIVNSIFIKNSRVRQYGCEQYRHVRYSKYFKRCFFVLLPIGVIILLGLFVAGLTNNISMNVAWLAIPGIPAADCLLSWLLAFLFAPFRLLSMCRKTKVAVKLHTR